MELNEYRSQRQLLNTRTKTPPEIDNGTYHRVTATDEDSNQNDTNSHNESELKLLAGASQTENIEAGNQHKKRSLHFNRPQWIANRPAWFTTISVGLVLTAIALIINASILGWINSSFLPADNGTVVLFSGPCSKASMISDTSHLAINILSTLLLAASNNCLQLLCSPTRAEVDEAHKSGQWLHIGVVGYRNLPWISYWRLIVCACLVLSSIPLHLLYVFVQCLQYCSLRPSFRR
jgi:hypothetical protein